MGLIFGYNHVGFQSPTKHLAGWTVFETYPTQRSLGTLIMRLGPKVQPSTLADGLFSKILQFSQISNCKAVYDFCHKKTRFQRKNYFSVKLNYFLQATKCPLDYQMHQILSFSNSNTLTKLRKETSLEA